MLLNQAETAINQATRVVEIAALAGNQVAIAALPPLPTHRLETVAEWGDRRDVEDYLDDATYVWGELIGWTSGESFLIVDAVPEGHGREAYLKLLTRYDNVTASSNMGKIGDVMTMKLEPGQDINILCSYL